MGAALTVVSSNAACQHRRVEETGYRVERHGGERRAWMLGICRTCGMRMRKPVRLKEVGSWGRDPDATVAANRESA